MRINKLLVIVLFLLCFCFSCSSTQDERKISYVSDVQIFDERIIHEILIHEKENMNRRLYFNDKDSMIVKIVVQGLPKEIYKITSIGKGIKLRKIKNDEFLIKVEKNNSDKIENRFDGCIQAMVADNASLTYRYTNVNTNKDTITYTKQIKGLIGEYCLIVK